MNMPPLPVSVEEAFLIFVNATIECAFKGITMENLIAREVSEHDFRIVLLKHIVSGGETR